MNLRSTTVAFLLPNLLAGLTTGLVSVIYSISFAALIFSGTLTAFLPQGVGTALIGATITAIVVAWRGSFAFALAGPESNSVIILALVASAIATSPIKAASVYPTIWAAIVLSSLITGLFLFALGRFRLGLWARFIPYPVIGGFLAGTGWLITRSSFKVMTGLPLEFSTIPQLLQWPTLGHWGAGLLFAIILLIILKRYKHFLVLPGLLFTGILCFDGIWAIINLFTQLKPERWFFKPFPSNEIWQAWNFDTFNQINWSVLIDQGSTLVAMIVIVMISIVLNATGLELATAGNVDLNKELRAHGVANLVNGMFGGVVGHISFSRSLLNHQAGATSPLAGAIAGGVCGMVLIFGSSFLAYLPQPILGGLLLYLGAHLLIRWIYEAWFQFPLLDYVLILVILVIIAVWGFLTGVSAGILIACFLFIFNYGRISSIKYTLSGSTYQSNVQRSFSQQIHLKTEGDCIYILVLQDFIFFGTANALLDQIHERLASADLLSLKFVVFDFRLVKGLDSSAVLSFMKLHQLSEKSHLHLVFAQLAPTIAQQLRQGGLLAKPEICSLFDDLDRGLEWCENQILAKDELHESPFIPLQSQLQTFFLDPKLVPKLMSYLQMLKIAKGEFLFQQGDTSDGLYFLESGQVTVVLELGNNQTKRLRTYNSGTILGEMGLYANAPRSASVVADQSSRLYFLSTPAFERIEIENPPLAAAFHKFIVNLLAERLKSCEEELKTLLQ